MAAAPAKWSKSMVAIRPSALRPDDVKAMRARPVRPVKVMKVTAAIDWPSLPPNGALWPLRRGKVNEVYGWH